MAGQSSGPRSYDIPELDLKLNLLSTINIVNFCKLNKIKKIVFSSSFTVYGDVKNKEQLSEKQKCDPKSFYAISKYASEKYLEKLCQKYKIGCIAFSPLAQGMLSEKYLNKIPKNSRASENSSLPKNMITKSYIKKIKGLSKIAKERGQTISQLALAWVLQNKSITSALIGSRNIKQLNECLDSFKNLKFSKLE